jgi:uncharacterized protein with ParB-like and HNH nuclease domain
LKTDDVKLYGQISGSFFFIPAYQREYSWGKNELEKLWEDILFQVNNENSGSHYFGSIVLKESNSEGSKLKVYEVIDGQQRLTTFTILVAAFLEHVNNLKDSDPELVTLYESLLFNDPSMSRNLSPTQKEKFHNKLELLYADRREYSKIMQILPRNDEKLKDYKKNLLVSAYQNFHLKIENYLGDTKAEQTSNTAKTKLDIFYNILVDQINVVVITLNDKDNVQRIFETLNNRGKPLAEKDLIKNLLMMSYPATAEEASELYSKNWRQFEDSTFWKGKNHLSHFLYIFLDQHITHRIVLQASRLSHDYERFIKEDLRAAIPDSSDTEYTKKLIQARAKYDAFIYELHHASIWYEKIKTSAIDTSEGEFIEIVTECDSSAWTPALWLNQNKAVFNSASLFKMREILERWFVLRRLAGLANTKQGVLSLMIFLHGYMMSASEIVDLETRAGAISNLPEELEIWIKNQAFESTRVPFGKQIEAYLLNQSIDINLARLILQYVEDNANNARVSVSHKVRGKKTPRNLTVEHLMPQDWEPHWTLPVSNSEKISNRNLHIKTLGNLVLVDGPTNSSLLNKSWVDKVSLLKNYKLVKTTQDLAATNPKTWNESTIERRSKDLAGKIISIWKPF